MAQPLQSLQVALLGLLRMGRLEDERGNFSGVLVEQGLGTGEIIVPEGDGQLSDRFRNAGVHRRRANEPVVHGEEGMVGAAATRSRPV